jgi:hypothetical protein
MRPDRPIVVFRRETILASKADSVVIDNEFNGPGIYCVEF